MSSRKDVLELIRGQSSHGFPQAPPREQQQEARDTPTPISALHEMPPSPRSSVSRKQLPTRVSRDRKTKWQRDMNTHLPQVEQIVYCIFQCLYITNVILTETESVLNENLRADKCVNAHISG